MTSTRPVITRFPPSPTGYLHIGSARTALYSWLYARQQGGKFILRIEDTDLERSNDASVQAILDGMEWLQLNFDEGPYYQTQRLERYREAAHQLVSSGHAYHCDCSKERLETLRTHQAAQNLHLGYDGHCREKHLTASEHTVIRLKVPSEGETRWIDLIKGEIVIANTELDDFVLVRSDGIPTYNFAVVVDDADMNVSHVIRGDDHVSNTPKQIHLYHAMHLPIPEFGHIPMILGSDGKRLSKRHGAVSVMQYEFEGYLPEALINYLVRLGWSHQDQEIFSREEMIQAFNFHTVSRSPAAFNLEKLNWLNQHYLKMLSPERLGQKMQKLAIAHQIEIHPASGSNWVALTPLYVERCHTLVELLTHMKPLYTQELKPADYDAAAVTKHLTQDTLPVLKALYDALSTQTSWSVESIHATLQQVATHCNVGMGKVGMPLRVCLTGMGQSPAIDHIAYHLGRDAVCNRIRAGMSLITGQQAES